MIVNFVALLWNPLIVVIVRSLKNRDEPTIVFRFSSSFFFAPRLKAKLPPTAIVHEITNYEG